MDNERTIVWAAAQTGRSTHATRDNVRTLCGLEVSPAAIPAGFHLREGDPIDCRRCREAVATLPRTGNQARRTVSIGTYNEHDRAVHLVTRIEGETVHVAVHASPAVAEPLARTIAEAGETVSIFQDAAKEYGIDCQVYGVHTQCGRCIPCRTRAVAARIEAPR